MGIFWLQFGVVEMWYYIVFVRWEGVRRSVMWGLNNIFDKCVQKYHFMSFNKNTIDFLYLYGNKLIQHPTGRHSGMELRATEISYIYLTYIGTYTCISIYVFSGYCEVGDLNTVPLRCNVSFEVLQ